MRQWWGLVRGLEGEWAKLEGVVEGGVEGESVEQRLERLSFELIEIEDRAEEARSRAERAEVDAEDESETCGETGDAGGKGAGGDADGGRAAFLGSAEAAECHALADRLEGKAEQCRKQIASEIRSLQDLARLVWAFDVLCHVI